MKYPLAFAGSHVESMDVGRRAFGRRRARRHGRPDNDDIVDDDGRRSRSEAILLRFVLRDAGLHIQHAIVPEIRIKATGTRIKGQQRIAPRDHENALNFPVGPVCDAPTRPRAWPRAGWFIGTEHPERFAGLGVCSDDDAAEARGKVKDAIHHQRRNLKVGERLRAEVVGLPAPRDLQVPDVFSIDLV